MHFPPIFTKGKVLEQNSQMGNGTCCSNVILFLVQASELFSPSTANLDMFSSLRVLTISSSAAHFFLTLSKRTTETSLLHIAQTIPGNPPPVPTSITFVLRGNNGSAMAQSIYVHRKYPDNRSNQSALRVHWLSIGRQHKPSIFLC